MNKLLLTLAGAALAFSASAADATYTVNFSDPESLGVAKAEPGEATVPTAPFGTSDITITVTQGADYGQNQELRFFTNSSGAVDFRTSAKGGQKGHKFEVKTKNGDNMVKIEFTGTNANLSVTTGVFDAGTKTWTGSANAVTFTTTGAVNLTKMVVTTGEGGGQGGETVSTIFAESFAASLGAFTIENVLLPEGFEYIWSWGGASYGAKASAYKDNTSYASDSYLISPVIDLTGASDITMAFDHVFNKFPSEAFAVENCTLVIREAGTSSWTKVAIPQHTDNTSWTFCNSGSIDLNAYAGKKIQFAFRYVSKDGESGTWEIKNLLVTGKGGITPPPTPQGEEYTLATSIVSGKQYVMTANGQLGAAIPETSTYGRLSLIDATFEGSTVFAEAVNAITIEEGDGGGYTLKDSYGRYLGFDGEHTTSFQLYTDVNEYDVWDIAFEGSNARITLIAAGKTGTLGVTKGTNGTWYTNIAPSVDAEEILLPVLYVKKDSSAVSTISVNDENAPVEYYNLQGIRVDNPANGIFVRRQGNNVTKVVIR